MHRHTQSLTNLIGSSLWRCSPKYIWIDCLLHVLNIETTSKLKLHKQTVAVMLPVWHHRLAENFASDNVLCLHSATAFDVPLSRVLKTSDVVLLLGCQQQKADRTEQVGCVLTMSHGYNTTTYISLLILFSVNSNSPFVQPTVRTFKNMTKD